MATELLRVKLPIDGKVLGGMLDSMTERHPDATCRAYNGSLIVEVADPELPTELPTAGAPEAKPAK